MCRLRSRSRNRQRIPSVDYPVLRNFDARRGANRRKNIGRHSQFTNRLALRNLAWPVHSGGYVHAAVEHAELISAKWRIATGGGELPVPPRALLGRRSLVAQD